MRRMRQSRVAVLALSALVVLGACSVKKVDEAHVGVKYTDGPMEGQRWDGVVEPGGSHTVVNDHVYLLPARQVTYIVGSDGAERCAECDAPALWLTTADGEAMEIELAVRFFLNTREDVLRRFFQEICQKHDCWTDEGWIAMLNETFGNPMQAVVSDLGLEYQGDDLRYDNAVRDEFASQFGENFVDSLERLVGRGDYFCGPGYNRNEEDCPALSVEVTSVKFRNAERESVREREELAVREAELAAQEERTAAAQARVDAAQATPEHIRLAEVEAMLACAQNPECQLTVITGSEGDLEVTVPAS